MKKPILLTKYELLKPVKQALDRIEKIRERKANNEDSIILEGLFILANSSFENSIYDTLRIFLKYIPDKIDIKEEKISKDVLLEGNPLELTIEKRINSLSYSNLKDVLNYFIQTIDIPLNNIFTEHYDRLCEIKASRNLLVHNNMKVNSYYLATAGSKKRSSQLGEKLNITQDYLYESISVFRDILSLFKAEMENKFNKYTYVNAVKNLFEFIFDTPVMKFNNEFTGDLISDDIIRYNENTSQRANLSYGEELYFSLWMSHWQGIGINLIDKNFYTLGDRDKLAYFISVIDILKKEMSYF